MAPSATETVVENVSNAVDALKLNGGEKKSDVRTSSLITAMSGLTYVVYLQKGPSYPFYFPHLDPTEKFEPTQIFG